MLMRRVCVFDVIVLFNSNFLKLYFLRIVHFLCRQAAAAAITREYPRVAPCRALLAEHDESIACDASADANINTAAAADAMDTDGGGAGGGAVDVSDVFCRVQVPHVAELRACVARVEALLEEVRPEAKPAFHPARKIIFVLCLGLICHFSHTFICLFCIP